MSIFFSILLILIGGGILAIPINELIISCKSASDITYTLGQKGGMRNGLIFYLACVAIGIALIAWGIFRLIS